MFFPFIISFFFSSVLVLHFFVDLGLYRREVLVYAD